MEQAIEVAREPHAMNLSTVSREGKPSSRIVLLRGIRKEGFEFFTNYRSRKGNEIKSKPWGALTFFWFELGRQVRIEGRLKKMSAKESDDYFATRPRSSQIGAWASDQSKLLKSRHELEESFEYYQQKFQDKKVPRPSHWGGYILVPDKIEFWQGRTNRLHDRLLFTRQRNRRWKIQRIAP